MNYVVTGAGRGIGRAVVERLLADGHTVVAIEKDPEASTNAITVTGDATDEEVTERAATLAAPLTGWVNNAAVFDRAAPFHTNPAVLEKITLNLDLALTGSRTAIRHFLAQGRPGAIVNVSSHQASRAVPGSTPYATAKAAIEGLTRALAVEYGPYGIRVNAVAPGSIETERYAEFLERQGDDLDREMARLHPLGRVGRAEEVAAVIAHLLSGDAAFVSGATVPVDGGRSALGQDPEALRTSG
jgi:NAD(P)-dependent dehydrogenase (short-subunit alcohol dehydrogenase family)